MSLEAEEEQTTSGSSKSIAKEGKMVPMDLLDEYWFFNNTLNGRRVMPKPSPSPKPPFSPKSPSPIKGKELTSEEDDAILSTPDKFATRTLLRTPSLPPIRVRREDIKEEAAAATGSSIMFEKQLGGDRIPARPLLRAPSMPTPCGELRRSHSPSKKPTSLDIRRYCSINGSNSYYRKSFQERKWNSLSDLESMEVQGFKDLGFVFDKEGLNENLANVIPGLRGKRASNDDDDGGNDNVIRPYLSEAWFVQRSAPPILKLVDKRSGVDMKDQLKFWARAVACNVRQEC
ncbi:uncharacterized protein [Typha latifolia]|uniref:uncharacterized protein n=1 Tax=Typha latifolia TaxID=4733 RepID=UPI003C2C38A9